MFVTGSRFWRRSRSLRSRPADRRPGWRLQVEALESRLVPAAAALGPNSLIQSTYGPAGQGDFEAVVLEGTSLVHYSHSGTDWGNPAWVRRGVITSQATGAG